MNKLRPRVEYPSDWTIRYFRDPLSMSPHTEYNLVLENEIEGGGQEYIWLVRLVVPPRTERLLRRVRSYWPFS